MVSVSLDTGDMGEKKKGHTISLISTPLTELPPLLNLGLAELARSGVRSVWVFGFGTEKLILQPLVSTYEDERIRSGVVVYLADTSGGQRRTRTPSTLA